MVLFTLYKFSHFTFTTTLYSRCQYELNVADEKTEAPRRLCYLSKVTELVEVEPGQIRNCKHPCPEPISTASGESLVFQQRSTGPD